jgi:hypothetical protein
MMEGRLTQEPEAVQGVGGQLVVYLVQVLELVLKLLLVVWLRGQLIQELEQAEAGQLARQLMQEPVLEEEVCLRGHQTQEPQLVEEVLLSLLPSGVAALPLGRHQCQVCWGEQQPRLACPWLLAWQGQACLQCCCQGF